MAGLQKESLGACAAALEQYGFVARRQGLFLQPSNSKDESGWLGLNLATWGLPAKLQINPVVGVRHLPLERSLVSLAGWPAPVPSVARPIGYLMPQNTFVQWEFEAGSDLTSTARELAAAVAELPEFDPAHPVGCKGWAKMRQIPEQALTKPRAQEIEHPGFAEGSDDSGFRFVRPR